MSTYPALVPATAPLIPVASAVKAQFDNPPDLEALVRSMLSGALGENYPTLIIDLQRTQLAVPRLTIGWDLQPFMPTVLAYLGSGTELDFTPRNNQPYYLCDDPPTWLAPAEGKLDMAVVKEVIEELTWRVPIGLQSALTHFWSAQANTGTSRLRWLSHLLKDTLSISVVQQTDLNDTHRAAIKQILDCPERADRIGQYGEGATRAYLAKATLVNSTSRSILSTRLVIELPGQVLSWSPSATVRPFKTLNSFARAWSRSIGQSVTTEEVHIKRFELDGNIFDAQSAAILNQQLTNLSMLKLPSSLGWTQLQAVYQDIADPSSIFISTPRLAPNTLAALEQKLPDWLKKAALADQALYRQFSLALASTKKNHQGKTFLSGIADIRSYTVDVLQQLMMGERSRLEPEVQPQTPEAQLAPDDIELTFHTVTGLPGTIGIEEPVTMTLTELALKNLQGRPTGRLTVRHRLGLSLPTWLTPDYITRSQGLIEQANIGGDYPKRLENLLLSNTPDAQARERLFAEHLRVQLPLLALELSLKHENGVTPLGARYVAALVKTLAADRETDGQTVVIRYLALVRKPEATADVVSNMFIIEPANIDVGPHLLYRPLYAQSLLEFATRDALLDAIVKPGALQTSVLTWLSDSARPIYDNGGFLEPHYVRFGTGDEFAPREVPAPAQLATDGASSELLQYLHNGQLMLSLYGSNARALVDQADAESVSNRESRWAVLLQGGGLIFDSLLLLPGLPRPLMLTGWLLSLARSAAQDIPALASNDAEERELAMVDVLINLGMVLLHLAPRLTPDRPAQLTTMRKMALRPIAPRRNAEEWPAPPLPKIFEGAVALPGEFPNTQSTVLDFSFFGPYRLDASQRTRLARFQVARPVPLPPAHASGTGKGLYRIDQKWHVLIDAQLYEVQLNEEASATIVLPTDNNQRGPNVRSDTDGNWSLDLGLRLHGGMPPKRIAAYQQQKQARINELKATLEGFFDQERSLFDIVEKTRSIYVQASTDTRFTPEQLALLRTRLEAALSRQLMAYQELLNSMSERIQLQIPFSEKVVISLLQKVFDNRSVALSYLATEQRILTRQWPQFTTPGPELEAAGDADPQGFLQFIKLQIDLNERAVEYVELRNNFLDQLTNLSDAGTEAANQLTSSLSPDEHTSLTLKSFLLSCLKLASSKTTASFRVQDSLDNAIDPLREYIHTHNQLNSLELESGRRLEVLDSLVEHYGQALDAVQGIELINAEELEMNYFNKLRQLLTQLYQDATTQLAAEIKPPAKPRKKPRKRVPSATGRPLRKVIKARGKGSLIGSVRPAGGEWPIEVVEIRDAYDNKVLSTYSQHGDEWVQITSPRPVAPIAKRPLDVIKGLARKLYGMFETIQRKALQYKNQARHPQEIEEILTHEASKFDTLADELHAAWLGQPEPARLPADQTLINDMHSAAQRLQAQGKALRLQLCLELPPTHGNLHYLLDEGRVQIAGLGRRIQLTGERQDFIQEYAISEPGKTPLWYAHFHYEQLDTPKERYTVAHLKTGEQRKQSYYSQLNTAQTGQAIVNIHRGQIGKAMAERWFLPLAN